MLSGVHEDRGEVPGIFMVCNLEVGSELPAVRELQSIVGFHLEVLPPSGVVPFRWLTPAYGDTESVIASVKTVFNRQPKGEFLFGRADVLRTQ